MAKKIIRYNLELDGTIPPYIEDGGYFASSNSNQPPQDLDLIGVTDSTETGLAEFENKESLLEYLQDVGQEWKSDDGSAFDFVGAVDWIWAKTT